MVVAVMMGSPFSLALQQLLLFLLLFCGAMRTTSTPVNLDVVKRDIRSLVGSQAPLYLPVFVSPDSPCGQALQDMALSLSSNYSLWAAQIVDSWGKTLDGLLMPNFRYYGNFDECVRVDAGSFTGKYCVMETSLLADKRTPRMTETRPWRPDAPWIKEMNRHPRMVANGITNDQYSYSTCMPSVCTKQELQESLTKVLLPQGVYPMVISCSVLNPSVEFTTPDIGFTSFLTFLVVLVACASVVDMFLAHTGNQQMNKGVLRYLLVFSAYTNLGKMLQVNPSPSPGTISCLHGMRVLSMMWVIYCHQFAVPLLYMVNITSYITSLKGFLGQIILNGYPSVDSFFFLSGLLVSYSVLRAAKKSEGRFNVPLFFVHRIIRLVPPLAIVIGLVATVLRFFAFGPAAFIWSYWYEMCKEHWWKDLLFINNFMQESGDCIGQGWYLGVDVQLYLVAPIIILPLYRSKAPGEAFLIVVTVFSAIIPAAITYINDLVPAMLQGQGDTTLAFYLRYLTPWCRASPWLVGVWLGYFIYRQGNVRHKMSMIAVVTGWSVASLTGVFVVFGMYSYNQLINALPYDVMTQIAYSGLHRLAWGAALGWMVYACHNGYGGVVNDFLSHPIWQPFSRLTYITYLVAVQVQYLIFYNIRQPYYYTHLNTIISTVGATILSIILAAFVSLLAESPVIGLERLLLAPGNRATKKTPRKDERKEGSVCESVQLPPVDGQTLNAHKPSSSRPPVRQEEGVVFTLGHGKEDRDLGGKENVVNVSVAIGST